jgi:hypothetical protein
MHEADEMTEMKINGIMDQWGSLFLTIKMLAKTIRTQHHQCMPTPPYIVTENSAIMMTMIQKIASRSQDDLNMSLNSSEEKYAPITATKSMDIISRVSPTRRKLLKTFEMERAMRAKIRDIVVR